MAFSVTPTSGEPPYTLLADISDHVNIDGVHYTASVRYTTLSGSCPTVGEDQALSAAQINTLISTGSVVLFPTVAVGSCRTFTLTITRVSDNVVIASSSVYVNNV